MNAFFNIGDVVNIDTETLGASDDEAFMLCLVDKDLLIESVIAIDEEFYFYRCSLGGVELLFDFSDADLVKKVIYRLRAA